MSVDQRELKRDLLVQKVHSQVLLLDPKVHFVLFNLGLFLAGEGNFKVQTDLRGVESPFIANVFDRYWESLSSAYQYQHRQKRDSRYQKVAYWYLFLPHNDTIAVNLEWDVLKNKPTGLFVTISYNGKHSVNQKAKATQSGLIDYLRKRFPQYRRKLSGLKNCVVSSIP